MQALELGPRQKQVLAAAVTLTGLAVIALFIYGFFIVLARFVGRFSPVLTPLAVAAILALILRPYYEWLAVRVRWRPAAVVLVFASLLLPVLGASWLFGSILADQLKGLIQQLPVWLDAISLRVESWLPQLNTFWHEQEVGSKVRQGLTGKGGWLAAQLGIALQRIFAAGLGVFQVLGGLFSWIVLPVYLVFLLTARPLSVDKLDGLLPFLKPDTRSDVTYLAREFVSILVAFFRGQLVIAAAQGVLYGAGFGLVGLQYGVAIGLTLGFLNIIPYLGNIVGLGVALPLAFFQPGGGWGLVAMVFAVFCVVQAVEAYLLTPRIMGEKTGLHPMAVIFALFFWGTALDGLLGMILGIPLTAFLVVFWRLLQAKYIKELV
jgi:predicted PurR-regulated permease PerM